MSMESKFHVMKISVTLIIFFLITGFSQILFPQALAFETYGGAGAAHPWLSALQIGNHVGLPIHQDITKDGLYFLNNDIKTTLADQHLFMEANQTSIYHFDNCAFSGTVNNINQRYQIAVSKLNPSKPDLNGAAEEFGRLLHQAQDFYSHSNWVEMHRTDLIDDTYSYWRSITPFSYTGNEHPVFSLEVPADGSTKSKIYSRNYNEKVIHVKENDTSYPTVGLISGTYGDSIYNRCPSDASIPHGSSIGPHFSFADAEKLSEPDALNKDHPKITGHKMARELATEQTTHEFCRLVELVRGTWGEDGVKLIYDNWVADKAKASTDCPPVQVTALSLPGSSGVHIAEGKEIKLNSGIVGFSDGTIKIPDGTIILPDRTVIDSDGKRWSPNPQIDPTKSIAILPNGTQIQIKVIQNIDSAPKVEKNETNQENMTVQSPKLIPDWFKNNALWWHQGLISEADIINGIESLMEQEIIKIDSSKTSAQNFEQAQTQANIPKYIKDVFGFWSQNLVSDSEIVDSLKYLVEHGIIKSKKLSKIPDQNFQALDNPDALKDLYLSSSWQEFGSFVLLKIKNYEKNTLEELSKTTWIDYSKNKNQELMKYAQVLEDSKNKAKGQAIDAVEIQSTITATTKEIAKAANNAGVSQPDLENQVNEITDKKESFGEINSDQDLKNAYKTGQEAIDKSVSVLKNSKPYQEFAKNNGEKPENMIGSNSQNSVDKLTHMILDGPLVKTDSKIATSHSQIAVQSQHFSYEPMPGHDLCDDSPNDYEIFINIVFSEKFNGEYPVSWYLDGDPKLSGIIKVQEGIISGSLKNFPVGNWTLKILKSDFADLADDVVLYVNIPPADCSEETFVSEPPKEPEGDYVTVLVIGGNHYPVSQFKSAHPDNCLEFHYHSIFTQVRSIDGIFISDPDKANCGFGPIDSIPVIDVFMTNDQIDSFTKDMGIGP